MAKIFVQGKGWIDEEVARQMAQEQAATLADLMPAAPAPVASGSRMERIPMERASLRANENALMEGQRPVYDELAMEGRNSQGMLNQMNARLSDVLDPAKATGSWSMGPERPKLTITGAPREQTAGSGLNYEQTLAQADAANKTQLYIQQQSRDLTGVLTNPASTPAQREAAFKGLQALEKTRSLGAPPGSSIEEQQAAATLAKTKAETEKALRPPVDETANYIAREAAKTDELKKRAAWEATQPGTDAYKRIQKETADAEAGAASRTKLIDTMRDFKGAIENTMGQKNLAAAVGPWDYDTSPLWSPSGALSGNWGGPKADAQTSIKNLREFAQVIGLQDLRASGVRPGSVTEKEWPKFERLVGQLDPNTSEPEFNRRLKEVYDKYTRIVELVESEGISLKEAPAAPKATAAAPAAPQAKVMTMQDVMDTAKARKMSIDEVLAAAKAKGYTVK